MGEEFTSHGKLIIQEHHLISQIYNISRWMAYIYIVFMTHNMLNVTTQIIKIRVNSVWAVYRSRVVRN